MDGLEAQGMRVAVSANQTYTTMVPVTGVKNISFRTGSATVIDDTDLDSTAKQKRMGLPDEGQCTFTLKFRPAETSHDMLLAAKSDRQARAFEVSMTDSPVTKYRFLGYVLSVPVSGSVDGIIESNVTVEISGPVTEAP